MNECLKNYVHTYIYICIHLVFFLSFHSFINKKEIVSHQRISSNVLQTMLMTEEKKCHIHTHTRTEKKGRTRKGDVLIIRRTFCCHGVFVSTKDEEREREKKRG
jgi:DNA-directed RNA polymerase subunit H (RpoH/RPB5)